MSVNHSPVVPLRFGQLPKIFLKIFSTSKGTLSVCVKKMVKFCLILCDAYYDFDKVKVRDKGCNCSNTYT